MSPEPSGLGAVRSAAAVNAEIRRLWTDPRVPLTDELRARRDALYVEWVAAVEAERDTVGEAA
jgi:hypothetical protein